IGLTFALFLMVNRQLAQALGNEVKALAASSEALRASEARLQQAELDAKVGHWQLHIDTRQVIGSAGAQAIYGLHGDKFDYSAVKEVPLPAYRPALDAAIHGLLAGSAPYDLDIQIRAADTGALKDVHSVATFNTDKRTVFGIIQDVTERKAADHKLQLAASVFTHAREGIAITDAGGTIMDVNAAFSRITGYSRAEAVGQNPRMLKSGRQPPAFYDSMWRDLAQQGSWTGEIWNRRKSGEVYAEMLTISGVRDASGVLTHYVALFSDISLMKAHENELDRLAHLDPLTQLPNRTLLAERLRDALILSQQRKRAMAVVFLDLDGFKGVNDTHGHDAGDELLIALANRLKCTLREGDTLARVGGDEF
ncbi:MAG: diguanylate cyclase, partial [Burkholderiales bacterium]|nr:diguanylate cyclase [Burkholderiales bacterium]